MLGVSKARMYYRAPLTRAIQHKSLQVDCVTVASDITYKVDLIVLQNKEIAKERPAFDLGDWTWRKKYYFKEWARAPSRSIIPSFVLVSTEASGKNARTSSTSGLGTFICSSAPKDCHN